MDSRHPITNLIGEVRQRVPGAARLTADSRQVTPGDVFIAMPGHSHDGRQYIDAALAAGAAAVLWDPQGYDWSAPQDVANWPVAGLRARAASLAAEWCGHPSDRLWMVGVTGTNGKTSCSHWLAECFGQLGRPTAVIGTLGNGFPDRLQGSSHTTPDAVTLQGLLANYRDSGATGVAMEVSSHALDQGRVEGVNFDVAVLTNLSRDHLDYHGDMAAYASAKARLFDWPDLQWAVINQEDDLGARLLAKHRDGTVSVLGYGFSAGEIRGEQLALRADGLRMTVHTPWGRGELESPLLGRFNADNLLACLGVLLASGVPLESALQSLSTVAPVAGRMQRLGGKDGLPTIVVDYAHTPDALQKTLAALRDLTRGQLACVFGCGGGRDKGKRPLMGEVAARLADRVIVTSDNPRNEAPDDIIADILAGMPAGQIVRQDRAQAIAEAVAWAQPDDVVLIAGKGHEDYQEIHGVRSPFSDVEQVRRALGQIGRQTGGEYQHASA